MPDCENYRTRLGKSMSGPKGPHLKVSEDAMTDVPYLRYWALKADHPVDRGY